MKTLISLLAGLITFGIIYILGAFTCADLNIANWDMGTRAFIAFMGFVAACCVAGGTAEHLKH